VTLFTDRWTNQQTETQPGLTNNEIINKLILHNIWQLQSRHVTAFVSTATLLLTCMPYGLKTSCNSLHGRDQGQTSKMVTIEEMDACYQEVILHLYITINQSIKLIKNKHV